MQFSSDDETDDFYAAQAMMEINYDENWEPDNLESWIYADVLFDLSDEYE
jgi:hypothetical protein